MPPLHIGLCIKQAIRPLSLTPLQGGIFGLRITFSGGVGPLSSASSSCVVPGVKQGASAGTLPAQQLALCCAKLVSWWQEHEALCLHSSWSYAVPTGRFVNAVLRGGCSSCSTPFAQLTDTEVMLTVMPAEQYPEKPPRVRFTSDM